MTQRRRWQGFCLTYPELEFEFPTSAPFPSHNKVVVNFMAVPQDIQTTTVISVLPICLHKWKPSPLSLKSEELIASFPRKSVDLRANAPCVLNKASCIPLSQHRL